MPLFFEENDITKVSCDCIIISADVSLKPTGGMSTAVYNAVKEPKKLAKECERIGFCGGCECVTTNSHGLNSPYIIHSVAPIFADSKNRAEEYLALCYKNAIGTAGYKGFESVAVPLIGTGKKGFSKEMSLRLAVDAAQNYLNKFDMNITIVVHHKASFQPDSKLIEDVTDYINKNYTQQRAFCCTDSFTYTDTLTQAVTFAGVPTESEVKKADSEAAEAETVDFPVILKSAIKNSTVKQNKLYRRANIEKNAFARLKNNSGKQPTKEAVLALAAALEMTAQQADKFLTDCRYPTDNSSKQYVILKYFLEKGIYNVNIINQMLFYFNEEQLGALI